MSQTQVIETAVIEQAKGIIMGGRRCSGEEAFSLLIDIATRSGRSVPQIAQNLVDSVSP